MFQTPGTWRDLKLDGAVRYMSTFAKHVGLQTSKTLVDLQGLDWRQMHMGHGGKSAMRRLNLYFGDYSYHYSGIIQVATPRDEWPASVLRVLESVESVTGQQFNACLLNYYRNGADRIGWHSDDTRHLVSGSLIAAVSFGTTRTLKFRRKNNDIKKAVGLCDGSLITMTDDSQQNWEHSISADRKVKDCRISLTFRLVKSAN